LFILAGQHVEPLYRIDSNSVSATIIVSSRLVWTCTYLMKFSSRRRNPPMDRSRKAQFTKPVKFSNPDVHDRSESRGLWMGLSGCDFLIFCSTAWISSALVTLCALLHLTPSCSPDIFETTVAHLSLVLRFRQSSN
jgi:hypothetical protein